MTAPTLIENATTRDAQRPLKVMFAVTSMPVGGAETLLVNLVRRLDPARFRPELVCLKERGPLGDELAGEIPVHCGLIGGKYDVRVLGRLARLFSNRNVDALVTVGAGDKMFWGRLAARWARVPVVVSALHSTGWPDGVGRLNRMLTRITDAFVGVAETHGRFLVEHEGFPPEKVHVIPNGVDTERFSPLIGQGDSLRSQLGLGPTTPVAGIVAALRPEKNHELFLASAKQVLRTIPEARFLIVGDGDLRGALEARAAELDVAHAVKFLGTRSDVPQVLGLLDVFLLTSHNEANPVSILEAMSMARPVIATRVGSVEQSVHHGETGYVVDPGDAGAVARHCVELLSKPLVARAMGAAGRRQVVEHGSLDAMVRGYEDLIERLFQDSAAAPRRPQPQEA